MDDARTELLSRYMDGDLEPSEATAVEERLKNDSGFAAELRDLETVRESLAALAERDRPPAELDAMMEPLCRSAPLRPRVRPSVRWLGAAAALVLGFTVVMEVRRQHPAPAIEPRSQEATRARPAEPSERFSLAPLPTSSVSEEEQPLGAVDRLLASPLPEPILEELPALDVLGPLAAGEVDSLDKSTMAGAAPEMAGVESGYPDDQDGLKNKLRKRADATELPEQPSETGRRLREGEESTAGALAPAPRSGKAVVPWSDEATSRTSRLYVFLNGETAWLEFRPTTGCPIGRYSVRIRVTEGTVASAWSLGGNPSVPAARRYCAGEAVQGIELENVPDGDYLAELVVEMR